MKFLRWLREKIREYSASHGFTCDGCGAEIFDYPVHRLCERCESRMCKNDGKICAKCGRQTVAEGICLTCKRRPPKFTRGVSPFVYRGESASLINRLKNGNSVLALYFGESMADCFIERCAFAKDFAETATEAEEKRALLIVPVPLTEKRKWERGYNQSEELAEALCKRLQEKGYAAELRTDILEKRRETAQQKHMDYFSRLDNVAGAYHVHDRKACRGRTVLLVDDILTTGATGSECAARLLAAEAKEVFFLTATALPERK